MWVYSKTNAISTNFFITIGSVNTNELMVFCGYSTSIAGCYSFGFYSDDSHSTTAFTGELNNWGSYNLCL